MKEPEIVASDRGRSGMKLRMTILVLLTTLCVAGGFSLLVQAAAKSGSNRSAARPQAEAQAAKGLEGFWEGALEAGGQKLRLTLTIKKSPEGAYSGILVSVDQGGTPIPVSAITVEGDHVKFEISAVNGTYEGDFNPDRSQLTGSWTQSGPSLPLIFKRAEPPAPAAAAPRSPQQKPLDVPVGLFVPIAPTSFTADGKTHLVYELHMTNMSRLDCTLMSVEVLSGDTAARLVRYESKDLDALLGRPGYTGADKQKIGGGLRAVLYLWITLDAGAQPPATIEHHLTFKVGDDTEEMALAGGRIGVGRGPIVIDAPLRGDNWYAANGPSNTSGHRRALIPVGGNARIAQRFAIDWVRLGENGRTFTGDAKDNKNYRAYGSEALAVADGVVTAVKDSIPENIPGVNSRAVPITLETVGGNHVILDLGNGHFAFYAHLQPGSLRVKLGEKVRRGQVVGLVGNTGNSTEPHLHFHISNANSPLGSEGLPYALRAFEVQDKESFGKATATNSPAQKRTMEIPLENQIIRFSAEH
jgi:murein DD-endopeptidase MepM/ murein hydrolase activator NlpD